MAWTLDILLSFKKSISLSDFLPTVIDREKKRKKKKQ